MFPINKVSIPLRGVICGVGDRNLQSKEKQMIQKNTRASLHEFNDVYTRIKGHIPVMCPRSNGILMLEGVLVEEIYSLIAPGKVGFSLLTGLLRVYERVVTENKWAGVPDLDRILVNCSTLDSVIRFRNPVFHVPKAHLNPLEVDAAGAGIDSNLPCSLFTGLSEFVRVIAAHYLVDEESNKSTL